jgi:FMN phosphatase YigB (HAD superfamily)
MEPNRHDWTAPPDKELVLVDMDGTLADVSHRVHHVRGRGKKNWGAFFRGMVHDPPNEVIADWVRNLKPEYTVVILSGRPSNYARETVEWLRRHHIPFEHLLMRPAGDHRPDHIVKKELMDTLPRERIAFVIDDRSSVCRMWRSEGLRCFQIAEGDF